MEDYKEEHFILKLETNPCVFSAFFIDTFIVLMGLWLSYVAFVQYAWWSYLLSLVVLLAALGLGKSLLLKNVTLYKDRLLLEWYFFKDKIIFIKKIKEVRDLRVGFFCMKFTLLERQPFDFKSLWVIVNESILGTEEYLKLRIEIKKLVEGK